MQQPTVLFSFYILDRGDKCIYCREWARESPTPCTEDRDTHVHGMTTVLHDIMSKLPPGGEGTGAKAMTTSHYKMHLFTTATGYRFVMMTLPQFPTQRGQDILEAVFRGPFLEHVAKDPNYHRELSEPIVSTTFSNALQVFLIRQKLLALEQ